MPNSVTRSSITIVHWNYGDQNYTTVYNGRFTVDERYVQALGLFINYELIYMKKGILIGGIYSVQWHSRHVWISESAVAFVLIDWLFTQTTATLHRTK